MLQLRKSYFVSLDKETINDVSVPDTNEYEIKATECEIKELNVLFKEKDKREKNAVEYLAKPFNEWGADEERKAYDSYLMTIYKHLYKLGTPETKQKITRMRIKE